MKKVYLAGQPNKYESNWKKAFRGIEGFDFYDPEIDSDQTSSVTFFPQDLQAIEDADILVANPGIAPAEATWIEIGYFLKKDTTKPGETSKNLIMVWKDEREPKWSIEFVKKAGKIVNTVEEAVIELQNLA